LAVSKPSRTACLPCGFYKSHPAEFLGQPSCVWRAVEPYSSTPSCWRRAMFSRARSHLDLSSARSSTTTELRNRNMAGGGNGEGYEQITYLFRFLCLNLRC
jgi:hypothetical protein